MHSAKAKNRRLAPSLLLVLALLAITTGLTFVFEGIGGVLSGFNGAGRLIVSALPLALLGIGFAGMLQVLVAPSTVSKWMSEEKGLSGIGIAVLAGIASPGGPHLTYPLARTLLESGAGVGSTTAFVSTKEMGSLNRLFIWDLPFLGVPFTLARLIINLLMALAAALLVPVLYRLLPGRPPQAGAAPDVADQQKERR